MHDAYLMTMHPSHGTCDITRFAVLFNSSDRSVLASTRKHLRRFENAV